MMGIFDHFLSWLYVTRLFGERCLDYEFGCATCKAWKEHDEIFNE